MMATASLADAPSANAAFTSIAALQSAHLELLARVDAAERSPEPPNRAHVIELRAAMRSFQRRVAAAGALIDDPADRELAQSLLDFWSIREGYIIRLAEEARTTELKDSQPPRSRRTPILPDPYTLEPFDIDQAPDLDDALCPFVGLSAFSEQDAGRHIFYGREEAVSELTELVANHRMVVVSGSSGSGKSSLVMAGLVPMVRLNKQGGAAWTIWPPLQPGPDPIATLLLSLKPPDRDPQDWVSANRHSLETAPATLPHLIADEHTSSAPALLIVDQAEELVSMTADIDVQNAVSTAIASLVVAPHPLAHVVIVVREDMVQSLLSLPAFQALPADRVARFQPKPLTSAELREAVTGPAQAVGLNFEPGIVEDLVREVVNDPAALPLLQFTLAQLWASRWHNKVTRAAFESVGGPNQALGRIAEELYGKLGSVNNQQTARDIFMALVVPTVGNEYVRRRVRREALHLLRNPYQVDRVLNAFVRAGLIRLTPGIVADDDRFEVMHEALLRNWVRLTDWLLEARNADQRRLLVVNAARLWESSGRAPYHLAVGAALEEARPYATAEPIVGEYVEASQRADLAAQVRAKKSLYFARFAAVSFGLMTLIAFGFVIATIRSNRALSRANDVSNISSSYLAGSFCVLSKVKDVEACSREMASQANEIGNLIVDKPQVATPLGSGSANKTELVRQRKAQEK